ncbi:MAG: hypothetical protein ABR936_16700 [Bacteroidota bacterium]
MNNKSFQPWLLNRNDSRTYPSDVLGHIQNCYSLYPDWQIQGSKDPA